MWPWLIILLLLAIGFGPVYWFRPTARERRIAAMRQRARMRGLSIELQALPDTEPSAQHRVSAGGVVRAPTIACATYRRYDEAPVDTAPHWRIRRTALSVPGPAPGWRWDLTGALDTGRRGTSRYWAKVRPLIDRLPEDCQALEASPAAVSCAWQERADAASALDKVDALVGLLDELLELQRDFSPL